MSDDQKTEQSSTEVSDEFDIADVNTGLFDALYLLARIDGDLATVAGRAGLVPTDEVPDLLALAEEVQQKAVDVYARIRRIAITHAQGAGGTLTSPTTGVTWQVTKPQGSYSKGGIVRLPDVEVDR